ncbi:hypothetical protein H6G20_11470 [Desertifilum sp. FACHB-1129]|uniref:DUF4435 domain-containing protein n=2 Tax=Desertifilum tharense IPPAS B-1220 TaxID=1781255 RepID=A0A1E5QRS9_9CYAN|nr:MULTISPECIES: DUF3226 domain-containing protein [Desertifilum]MDA0210795.1 hypothetical protein [Cyanobacteria bacterium FC1]MBD2312281.1 hypothetical protein [Desertifilum sp. FACHB-1129]MBD2323652.1 hypothetical protein [Desertifilum sp. FACHB-866]MBD2332349.1 hypothetical protein [Desertifilum sp. FACHB-868]OEJ77043.1 hypothetical protein BH720_00990 [Desertifilum tharense IPPAS B-1220]
MSSKKDICKQDSDKVLLVEGTNDCHVVMSLCKANQVTEGLFGIYECGSDDDVLKRLNALIVRPNPPQVIGVMLDADSSLQLRWQSIRDKLRNNHSYVLPTNPDIDGTVVERLEDKPKLGFWLMPNNQDSGMLEDFCAKLAEPECFKFAQECVQEAQRKNIVTFKAAHYSKSVIHTYLAWQDEPGYPLGKAITGLALRSDIEIAVRFTNWLNRLFL